MKAIEPKGVGGEELAFKLFVCFKQKNADFDCSFQLYSQSKSQLNCGL